MRKKQKKMAEDFVTTLFEAHDEIKKLIRKSNLGEAMDLLGQCQDGAIRVGTMIEGSEGEGFVTVEHIETYCEKVYCVYEALRQREEQQKDNKAFSGDKLMKPLHKQLVGIENSLKNDVPTETEVVFLPYKAAMWDSLESVWKAAEDDPYCDAYVIPIPYYDRKPDRSFGELHYEGDQFPNNVPITHFQQYDFEKRRPDVIYIHNGYDDINIITSVHPFFYSQNLKQFTDKLVYIPYFILVEVDPANEEAVKGIKHFCNIPGVIHADQTIVQSEKMRQIYIDVLTEAHGKDTRKIWEEKILGLGSPKADKILSMKKEDVEIPESWLPIIQKPNGTRKKIIFYNTTIGAMLSKNEEMLDKMSRVFELFYENRDEIALLWRPHPLLRTTLQSMRPDLLQEYDTIVQQYKDNGWGIYDDTPDFDRAIVLCDAYYGDWSSAVQLCKEAGKPIMVQRTDVM